MTALKSDLQTCVCVWEEEEDEEEFRTDCLKAELKEVKNGFSFLFFDKMETHFGWESRIL